MKIVNLSLLLSLVLISSGTYAESNSLVLEGMALGRSICGTSERIGRDARHYQHLLNSPSLKNVFRVFSTYEPSTHQFKQAFSDLKMIFSGIGAGVDMSIRRAIENGDSKSFIQNLKFRPTLEQFFWDVGGDYNNHVYQRYIRQLKSRVAKVNFFVNVIVEAENIGQVFINIGSQLKSGQLFIDFVNQFKNQFKNHPRFRRFKRYAGMPISFQVPQNLNLMLNARSQAYTQSKELSNALFTLITDYVASGRYENSLQKVKAAGMSLQKVKVAGVSLFLHFIMSPNPRWNDGISAVASVVFNALIGFKEGLKAFSLSSRLARVKPFKATLIRFMHLLSLRALEVPEVFLKGGRPDINGFAQAFISCGKELEAMS